MNKRERKQQKVVEKYLGGMNKGDAYQAVYKCKATSAVVGATKIFRKPDVKKQIAEILGSDAALSLKRIAGTLKHDLNAKKQVVGAKNEILELRDNDMRHKSRESLLKLHEAPGYSNKVHIEGSKTVNINLGAADVSKLGSILAELKALGSAGSTVDEGQTDGEVIDITPVVE